jgi:ParB-like nuclease domain
MEISEPIPGKYQFLPAMSPDQRQALRRDIAERGILTPIDVDESGNILDGHHRFEIWRELKRNAPPPVIVRSGLSEDEKRSFALRQNIHRRHLTRQQMQELIGAELKQNANRSNRQIAADFGVDHKTIGRLRSALEATGEIPQLETTVGRDGKTRRTKTDGDAEAWAKAFGNKRINVDDFPDDWKLALFKAGIPASSVVAVDMGVWPAEQRLTNAQIAEWDLFGDLLVEKLRWSVEQVAHHFNYVIEHKGFLTPDEWLSKEGEDFRGRNGSPEPSDEFKGWWRARKGANGNPGSTRPPGSNA